MRVEACCQAVLTDLLPKIDPQRLGKCLDVGVGTFAFYCQQFAELGFEAIEVLEEIAEGGLSHGRPRQDRF